MPAAFDGLGPAAAAAAAVSYSMLDREWWFARPRIKLRVMRRPGAHAAPAHVNSGCLTRVYCHLLLEFSTHNVPPGVCFCISFVRRLDHMRPDYRHGPCSMLVMMHNGIDVGNELQLDLPSNGAFLLTLVPIYERSRGGQRPHFPFRATANGRPLPALRWTTAVFCGNAPDRRGPPLAPPDVLVAYI